MPCAVARHIANLQICNSDEKLPAFEAAMIREIAATAKRRLARGVARSVANVAGYGPRLIVRVHSSGDFYSPSYLMAWQRIARAVDGVAILVAYTRTWRKPSYHAALAYLACEPNFYLQASVDPSIAHEAIPPFFYRKAFVEGSIGAPPVNCEKQLIKGANCVSCKKCFEGTDAQVTFGVHGRIAEATAAQWRIVEPRKVRPNKCRPTMPRDWRNYLPRAREIVADAMTGGRGKLLTYNAPLGLLTWNIAAGFTCPGKSAWCCGGVA